MAIRFGVSPIAWTNDDMPELGGDTAVETILADAAEIGLPASSWAASFRASPPSLVRCWRAIAWP